jgi:hypothetical protein
MVDKKTDEDLASVNIFGDAPKIPETPVDNPPADTPPAEPTDEPPAEPPTDTPPAEPVDTPPAEPTDTPPAEPPTDTPPADAPQEPVAVSYDEIPSEKLLELFNKNFNTNFDTMDAASSIVGGQLKLKGQEEIIKKLVDKAKENNVLSHFPSENSYKVAQLAKEYPGKEAALTRAIGSDVDSLSDFEAIKLSEELRRPAGSKVDALGVKLRMMGITEDVKDYSEWDDMDKQVVLSAAEESRETLKQLQSKIEVPKEGGGEIDEFVSELESGFQAAEAKRKETIEANTPVAEKLVDSLTKIKPVEGSDFEYDISLAADGKKDLVDYLVAESVEGEYNIQSDKDINLLQGMLEQEVLATEGKKMMAAYGEYVKKETWAEARAKYENATPLDGEEPPVDPNAQTVKTDTDYANRILEGNG